MMASGIDPWRGYHQASFRRGHNTSPIRRGWLSEVRDTTGARAAVVVIAFSLVEMSGDF
jgi:hypothetical protein